MRRAEFTATLGFEVDPFQVQALEALDEGRSVLVAAPTGSGKTVVAEYAVAKALAEGGKAFYTTPLKALSNQKYADLVRRHGADNVGLLTGDNAINGDAPAVVMTTEVLRNMIYAGSDSLNGLRYVVLDEVHYLQNAYRGPVWEEVIIHTPPEVDLVCLSATVSNAEEVADWLRTVRGATDAVIEEKRPVQLHNLYMVGDRHGAEPLLLPTLVDGRPNREAEEIDRAAAGETRRYPDQQQRGPGPRRRSRYFPPRRTEVIEALGKRTMLPAIYFIFSRAGCDEAVRQCLRDGIRLTTPDERQLIRGIVESRVEALSDDDLRVLNYGDWLSGLEAGIAAHHAGMVPPFKEAVEACFAQALVKVVFATETLALGINMPARSVVIEKLTKFTGESHQPLSPGEYTQLTGRAGRRGIDDVGYGIVLFSPFVPFDQVASLASKRTYALSSAFRPTYNMAANLVRRYEPDVAHHLLNLSFAQYVTDREVVREEAQLERKRAEIDKLRERGRCELGDVEEYMRIEREVNKAGRQKPSSRTEIEAALSRVRLGDVLVAPGVAAGGRVAVVDTGHRGRGVKLGVVTAVAKKLLLTARDFPAPPRAVARIELPEPYLPTSKDFIRATADALRAASLRTDGIVGVQPNGAGRGARAMQLAAELAAHPVAQCPELNKHRKSLERAQSYMNDLKGLERRIRGRTESLARQFDRVLRVMEAWGYVDGWQLTPSGERLATLYHESDLLVAECIRSGLFDGLSPAEVAGLASTFTYETRGPAGAAVEPWFPRGSVQERFAHMEHIARELNLAEEEAGLPLTRALDPGFVALAYAWASGGDLDEIIADEVMTGGDFVRNIKQLIDLLRQMGDAAEEADTARACRRAADTLFRGVVSASSTVGADE